jgi:hypothetical protein
MTIEHARNPLRRARLAARLELSDLAERTRISPGMLRYMDEGAFDRLPAGIYARAWVRAVAEALSLNPADVLRELEHALPQAAPLEVAALDVGQGARRSESDAAARRHGGGVPTTERPAQLSTGDRWRRAGIAALDGTLLTGVTLAVWIIIAAVADVSPAGLGPAAVGGLSAIAVTLAVLYFAVFAGIGGRTPGAAMLGSPMEDDEGPLDLGGVGRRALVAALTEASIAVDMLLAAGADDRVLRFVLRRT